MAVSFKEFRDRFPEASIFSDLLMVHNQQYIVKVTIKTRDSASATGLAANTILEVAEDNARQRAFQVLLGLDDRDAVVSTLISPVPIEPADQTEVDYADYPATADGLFAPEQEAAPAPSATAPPPQPQPEEASRADSERVVSQATARSPQKTESLKPSVKDKPKPVQSINTSADLSAPPDLTHQDATFTEFIPADEAPISQAALPAPINLSDVIAQTDIELRRLQWTVEMGREYLEQTYNKRSRHELSEEELIQFLCHLEGLPETQTIA